MSMHLEDYLEKNSKTTINVTAGDLKTFAKNIVSETSQKILAECQDKIYTRQDVLEKFDVCSATLWRWENLGLIQGKKIGNRKYYSQSSINSMLNNREGAEHESTL